MDNKVFTGDVMRLVSGGSEQLRQLRIIALSQFSRDELPDVIMRSVMAVVAPSMIRDDTPNFVAHIVHRALTEYVDWKAVAEFAATVPENN